MGGQVFVSRQLTGPLGTHYSVIIRVVGMKQVHLLKYYPLLLMVMDIGYISRFFIGGDHHADMAQHIIGPAVMVGIVGIVPEQDITRYWNSRLVDQSFVAEGLMDPLGASSIVFIEILGQVYPGFKVYSPDNSGAVHLESRAVDCQIGSSLSPVGRINKLLLLLADTRAGGCTGAWTWAWVFYWSDA